MVSLDWRVAATILLPTDSFPDRGDVRARARDPPTIRNVWLLIWGERSRSATERSAWQTRGSRHPPAHRYRCGVGTITEYRSTAAHSGRSEWHCDRSHRLRDRSPQETSSRMFPGRALSRHVARAKHSADGGRKSVNLNN